jgi:hypothetical protein
LAFIDDERAMSKANQKFSSTFPISINFVAVAGGKTEIHLD